MLHELNGFASTIRPSLFTEIGKSSADIAPQPRKAPQSPLESMTEYAKAMVKSNRNTIKRSQVSGICVIDRSKLLADILGHVDI